MSPDQAYAALDRLHGLISAEALEDFLRGWDPAITDEEVAMALAYVNDPVDPELIRHTLIEPVARLQSHLAYAEDRARLDARYPRTL